MENGLNPFDVMHTIRLREPWDVEISSGHVLYRRHFNKPTGLERDDAVLLAIEQLPRDAEVRINDAVLAVGQAVWDITIQLQPRNAVTIEIAGDPPPPRPFGEVRLDIRAAAEGIG